MIDTPVARKFFKKLNLYLELKRQDKRVKKSNSDRGERIWAMEKAFLLWAIKGHWYLGSPLTPQYIKDRLEENGFSDVLEARQVAQNLIFKKYAVQGESSDGSPDSIQLTETGLYMGEVIEEINSKREYFYIWFSMFVWLTIFLAFLKVIEGIVLVIKKIVDLSFFSYLDSLKNSLAVDTLSLPVIFPQWDSLKIIFPNIYQDVSNLLEVNKFFEGIEWKDGFSFLNALALICGFYVTYLVLKKEVHFKKKLEVHEKITNLVAEQLYSSFFEVTTLAMNNFTITNSRPNDNSDYHMRYLRENSRNLSEKITNFTKNFQLLDEFFRSWKAMFSQKIDYEMKFLLDLESIVSRDLWEYQRKLSDFAYTSLLKSPAEISVLKSELLELEDKISKKTIVLANGMEKFVLDMGREVFSGFFKNSDSERLFNLEIENSKDGDRMLILTENGFIWKNYKKTSFQGTFGGFQERRNALRESIEQD